MPYIGKSPVGGGFHKLDALTASATATYALTLGSAAYYPETANQLLVSLNGVIQAPQDSFTVSGSNLVFDSALTASDSIDFVVALGDVLGVGSVTDGAITTAKIGNDAVTKAKIGTTELDLATIKDSTGTNTAITIDSSGRILMPSRPAFAVYTATTTNADYTTNTKVPFDTKEFDIGTNVTINSGAIFTAPISGIYQFNLTVMLFNLGSGTEYGSTMLYIDDALVQSAQDKTYRNLEDPQSGSYLTNSSSFMIQLTANQTVTPYVGIVGDTTVGIRDGSRFSGFLVG
jgi:hypothetical protein